MTRLELIRLAMERGYSCLVSKEYSGRPYYDRQLLQEVFWDLVVVTPIAIWKEARQNLLVIEGAETRVDRLQAIVFCTWDQEEDRPMFFVTGIGETLLQNCEMPEQAHDRN